jgi:hypothetical protein
LRESPSVPDHSASRNAVTAVIIFFAAHVALLVGVTTPEKFYFDEVHDVPAARQMLEPVMPASVARVCPSLANIMVQVGNNRPGPSLDAIIKSACRTPGRGGRCNCQFDAVLPSMLTT